MKVLVTFLFLAQLARATEILASLRDDDYVHEVLLVSDEEFTLVKLKETARKFLSKNKSVDFASLEIGTGLDVGYYSIKGTNHVNEDNYFHRLSLRLSEGPAVPNNIAALVKIGSWAVLRVKIRNQISTYNLGHHADPCFKSSADWEVLHLGPIFDAPKSVGGIEIYIRSRRNIQLQEVTRLAWCLKRSFDKLKFRILVRTDAWFVTDPNFPFVYAFDNPISIPTRREYEKRSTAVMGVAP